jgi:hypothetical protein
MLKYLNQKLQEFPRHLYSVASAESNQALQSRSNNEFLNMGLAIN